MPAYGDYGHQHFKQPASLRLQVDLVNAVRSATQAPGTTARQIERIDAALAVAAAGARDWGICTECAMGRVDATDVPELLDLHSAILTASR